MEENRLTCPKCGKVFMMPAPLCTRFRREEWLIMKRKMLVRIIAIALCVSMIGIPIFASAKTVDGTEQTAVTSTEDEAEAVPIDEEHFPDEALREYVKKECADGKDYLSNLDVELTTIVIIENSDIQSLQGIEYLKNVGVITLDDCNSITDLTVAGLPELCAVRADDCNNLSKVNITECPKLKKLFLTDTAASYDTVKLSNDEDLNMLWIGKGVRIELHSKNSVNKAQKNK